MSKHDYFSEENLRKDLKGKVVRGGLITGSAQLIKIASNFCLLGIIGWYLDPEDNGLVNMVTAITGLATIFTDAGLSMATVQKEKLDHKQTSNLFWIASSLGATICLIVALISPLLSWIYGEPRLTAITLVFALTFLLNGLTIQHQALLRRGMQFLRIAIADIVSSLAGLSAAIYWASTYYQQPSDYWALVFMPLTTSCVRLGMIWLLCPWRPGLPKRHVGTKNLVTFGANLTGANFTNYFARNADKFLIGWKWGAGPLGEYALAYKLLLWPLQQILGPISSVAIPALSRLQSDPESYRNFFRKGVVVSSAVLSPFVFACLVFAEDLISLLPERWHGTLPIFLALGPAAVAAITAPATHWVFVSWGHTSYFLKMTIFNSTCMILGFIVAVPFGPQAVAVTFSLVICVLRIPNIRYAFGPTPLQLNDLLIPISIPFLAAAIGALVIIGLKVSGFWLEPSLGSLLAGAPLFLVAYVAVLVVNPWNRNIPTMILQLRRDARQQTSPESK